MTVFKIVSAMCIIAIIGYITWYLVDSSAAWAFTVNAYRIRFSLIGIVSPVLLYLVAITAGRTYLYNLLVLRDEPSRFGFNQYYVDLTNVTILSLAVCLTSFATAQTTLLWSNDRFGEPSQFSERLFESPVPTVQPDSAEVTRKGSAVLGLYQATPSNNSTDSHRQKRQIGYFLALLGTIACGLFPVIMVASRSIANGIPTRHKHLRDENRFRRPAYEYATVRIFAWIGSATSIAIGIFITALILLGLAFSEVCLFPRANLALGINPFDLLFGAESSLLTKEGLLSGWVDRTSKSQSLENANTIGILISNKVSAILGFLGAGPGYIASKGPFEGLILPGHSQLILLGTFWTLIYACWYVRSLFESSWRYSNWPSLFYALILLFFFAWLMPGAAFFFDRYGIPPSLAIGIALLLGAFFFRTDHYFELLSRKAVSASSSPTSKPAPTQSLAYPNALLKAAEVADQELKRPYWMDAVDRLEIPKDKDGKRTLVVVTASGGGIQAAAWAAKVLSELDGQYKGFADSIGLVSGVSGGSVGVMQYLAHRGYRFDSSEKEALGESLAKLESVAADRAYHESRRSALEAVAWGIVFPDFLRTIFNPLAGRFRDRGWALEANWWNQLGSQKNDRNTVKNVRLSDFTRLVNAGRLPPVIFNSTVVQTGQRVLFSTIRQDGVMAPQLSASTAAALSSDSLGLGDKTSEPVDFEQYLAETYEELSRTTGSELVDETDIRLTTAVRLSSTFAYVAPVAKPYATKFNKLLKSLPQNEATKLARAKLNQHLADGGYADNTGLVTVVKLLRSLLDTYRTADQPGPKIDRIHLVRIEPFPPSRQVLQTKENGVQVSLLGPSTALDRARSATQAERGELEVGLLLKAFEKAKKERNETPIFTQQVIQYQSGDNELEAPAPQPKSSLNNGDESRAKRPSRKQKRAMPPLSWRLTPNNIRAIEQDWQTQKPQAQIHLDSIFSTRKKS